MKYRKVWKDFWGSIRKGSHIHHIVPKSEGGKDEIGNLIELHPDDHLLIHKMRGDVKATSGFLSIKGLDFSGENHWCYGKKRPEMVGENNPSANNDSHWFQHKLYGLVWCNRYVLCENYNLKLKGVKGMINGFQKTAQGWSMKEVSNV
jgi:hypothetical protein